MSRATACVTFSQSRPPYVDARVPRRFGSTPTNPLFNGTARITDERSPVTMLGATPSQSALAPIFRTPNALGPEDWEGWVQERALYCPRTWSAEYRSPLAMNDPGESPVQGCLLEASVGRGSWVYTGVSFFRELPAGVPGAYRLFFNLLGGRATP